MDNRFNHNNLFSHVYSILNIFLQAVFMFERSQLDNSEYMKGGLTYQS